MINLNTKIVKIISAYEVAMLDFSEDDDIHKLMFKRVEFHKEINKLSERTFEESKRLQNFRDYDHGQR